MQILFKFNWCKCQLHFLLFSILYALSVSIFRWEFWVSFKLWGKSLNLIVHFKLWYLAFSTTRFGSVSLCSWYSVYFVIWKTVIGWLGFNSIIDRIGGLWCHLLIFAIFMLRINGYNIILSIYKIGQRYHRFTLSKIHLHRKFELSKTIWCPASGTIVIFTFLIFYWIILWAPSFGIQSWSPK